jgi:DNA-binding XRE family transcriptional regulator
MVVAVPDTRCNWVSLATTNSGVEVKKHILNIEIGRRLREERTKEKITQQLLADVLNITPQQIQKYEKGINAIPVHKLREIILLFNKDPKYFLLLDSS